jgi:hypothetical protein
VQWRALRVHAYVHNNAAAYLGIPLSLILVIFKASNAEEVALGWIWVLGAAAIPLGVQLLVTLLATAIYRGANRTPAPSSATPLPPAVQGPLAARKHPALLIDGDALRLFVVMWLMLLGWQLDALADTDKMAYPWWVVFVPLWVSTILYLFSYLPMQLFGSRWARIENQPGCQRWDAKMATYYVTALLVVAFEIMLHAQLEFAAADIGIARLWSPLWIAWSTTLILLALSS